MSKSSPFGEIAPDDPHNMPSNVPSLEACGIEGMTNAQLAAARRITLEGLNQLDERGVLQAYDVPQLAEDIFDGVKNPHYKNILPSIPSIARENAVQAWLGLKKKGDGEQQVFVMPSYLDGLVCVVPSSLVGRERRNAKRQQRSDLKVVSQIATRVIEGIIADEAVHHDVISPRTLVQMGNRILAAGGETIFATRYGTAILPYIRKDGSLVRAEDDGEYQLIPRLRAEQRAVASLLPPKQVRTPDSVTEVEPAVLAVPPEGYLTNDSAREAPIRSKASPKRGSAPSSARRGRSTKQAHPHGRQASDLEAAPDTLSGLTQALSADVLDRLASLRNALVDGSSTSDSQTLPTESEQSTAPQTKDPEVIMRQEDRSATESRDENPETLADIPDAPTQVPRRSIEAFKAAVDQAKLHSRITQERFEYLEGLPEERLRAHLAAQLQAYCEQRALGGVTIKTANGIFKDITLGKGTLPGDAKRDISVMLPRSRKAFDGVIGQNERFSRHRDLPFYVVAAPEHPEGKIAEAHAKIAQVVESVDRAIAHLLEAGVTSIGLNEFRAESARLGRPITDGVRSIFMSYVRSHPLLHRRGDLYLYGSAEAKRAAEAEHTDGSPA
jgi:hypothetical protein